MTDIGYDDRTRAPDQQSPVRQAAAGAADAAGSAASDIAGTAKDQARQVTAEAKSQVRNLASNMRQRVGTEARSQNERLTSTVRSFADELDQMASDRGDSPARGLVSQVSQGGRRLADYLDEHGPEGVLAEVQDFARRRPGTFLAVAAAAGFVVGRLGKSVFSAATEDTGPSEQPSRVGDVPTSTTYVSTTATAFPAETTPVVPAPPVTPVTPAPPVPPVAPTTATPPTTFVSPTTDPGDLRGVRP